LKIKKSIFKREKTYIWIKNIINNSHTPTLKDSLTKTENEKVTKEKKITKSNNKINPTYKKSINISSLSTQHQVNNDLNMNFFSNKKENQTTSIPVCKEIVKYIEPRFKLANFQKLDPKFNKSTDNNASGIFSQNYSHDITKSEMEFMEIDEKLPLKKLEQMESNRIRSIINENFPFHFLIEIEKCYQEISKDLKINNKDLLYKVNFLMILSLYYLMINGLNSHIFLKFFFLPQ